MDHITVSSFTLSASPKYRPGHCPVCGVRLSKSGGGKKGEWVLWVVLIAIVAIGSCRELCKAKQKGNEILPSKVAPACDAK